jgi:endonuclease YncB( thermonuclease family)
LLCYWRWLRSVRFPRKQGVTGVASVIDGDHIEIHGQNIRLYGIDAPESSQFCVRLTGERWRCGQQASFASGARLLAANPVIKTATAVASPSALMEMST